VRRLLVPLVVLTSVLLTVAACGSATNDYRGKVADVQKKYNAQLTELTTKVTTDLSTNPRAASASLSELATVVSQFAEDIAGVKPPADKQPLADQLVGAYRTLAQASLDLKVALDSKDTAAMNKALEEFNKATADESAAIDAFNAAD
jgi:uncharacterized lipoprotein